MSSLVIAMSVEELRSLCQVPVDISLELSDRAVVLTVGGADNVVFFTRGPFAAGLIFHVLSLVEQFCTSPGHLLCLYIRTFFGFLWVVVC